MESGAPSPTQQALDALLRQIPGLDRKGLQQLDPNQFTPDKVAARIAGAVSAGLANARAQGRSEQELQSLYESALRGVEQGFKDAREVLGNLNLLQGKVADRIDETEVLTNRALADLVPGARAGGSAQGLAAVAFSAAERFQRADSFELNLKTQEGDLVTIRFDRSLDYQASVQAAAIERRDGSGTFSAAASRLDASLNEFAGFEISYQGHLNDAEKGAINDLLRDVGRLSDEFFNGDVQKAFEQAGRLSFDGSQLARMDLNLQRTESYTQVRRYQEVAQLGRPSAETQPGQRLGQLMRDMRESFNRSVLDFLQQPAQSAGSMMQELVTRDARFMDAGAERQGRLGENLDQLLQWLNAVPADAPAATLERAA